MLREPFLTIYEAVIRPVCAEFKVSCGHAGEIFGPGRIINDVYALITRSKVVVADLTGRNPNVFYELGLAHDQGKPVIQLSQEIEDAPFDVLGLRTICYEWDDCSEEAVESLKNDFRLHLGAALGIRS